MNWFLLVAFSTLFLGMQNFLYKASAQKGCNKFMVAMTYMITQEVLALIVFVAVGPTFENIFRALLLGLLLAIIFFTKVIFDLKAMEHLPANKVVPIVSGNVFFVVLYGIIFLNEKLTPLQFLGIIFIVSSVILINIKSSRENKDLKVKTGLIFAMLSIVATAGTAIINKYAAVSTDPNLFNVIVQFFLVLVSFTVFRITKQNGNDKGRQDIIFKDSVKIGVAIGIVSFIAYISYLYSLTEGPLSVISSVQALSTMVTVVLAWLIYKERLTKSQLALVALSILGVILTRI